MPSFAALRHAPWSLSKIKCALRCPHEFELKYIKRLKEPQVEPDLRIGKALHLAIEAALLHKPLAEALANARKELLHEEEHRRYDELAPAVRTFLARVDEFRARHRVRSEYVEHALAVNSDFEPTGFNATDAFFRGVWDVGFVYDDDWLAVVDHKSGVRHVMSFYEDQLRGYAVLAGTHFRDMRKIWLGVHFIAEAAVQWSPPLEIIDVEGQMVPRVLSLIEQAAEAVRDHFEPRPSWWCDRCGYRSVCTAKRKASGDAPSDAADAIAGFGEALADGGESA